MYFKIVAKLVEPQDWLEVIAVDYVTIDCNKSVCLYR